MHVVVTGATGFIGRALVGALLERGDAVTAWTRDVARGRKLLGPDVSLAAGDELDAAVDGCDAVVNLAGESIVGRWSDAKKETLTRSRVGLTGRVVEAIAAAQTRPPVLVSGSAVGIFQPGFMQTLCAAWEAAALPAEELGVRVAIVRIGLVLGTGGGLLGKMGPVFKLGLGGRLGSGDQWMSWIHLDDLVRVILHAIDEPISGALTATAPGPVTNEEFSKALGRALGRPAVLPVPAFAIQLVMGEAAEMLLDGVRALPADLLESGFTFAYEDLDGALSEVLSQP
ncbi:MAG: hypothetical protein ACI9WU_001417 [Myxococcota bacterium]|jgi:uncharacterized protein (TIGR01777 family)